MADLFDTLTEDPKKKKKDLFDEIEPAPGGDVFDQVAPEAPAAEPTPRGTNGQTIYPPASVPFEILKGLPGLVADIAAPTKEAGMNAAAAAAYEAAGAAKGATLGYVDPTRALEKTPLAKADINKNVAEGAGQFVGALAPISKISQAVHAGMLATGALEGVRPILAGLVQSGIVGSIYGAARKPEEETASMRAHNALDDAATFIVFTGAGQLVDKAAQALSLGKTNAYNSLRDDIIQTFTKKGAPPEQAAVMADAGLQAAVERGGGWSELKASDLREARRAVRAGQKFVIGESSGADGGPSQPGAALPPGLPGPEGAAPPVSSENTSLPQEGKKPTLSPVAGGEPHEPGEPISTTIDEKSVSIPGIKYLQTKFPALAQAVVGKSIALPPEQMQEVLKQAAAAGEEVLLKGGTQEQANIAAVKRFGEAAQPLITQPAPQNAPEAPESNPSANPDVFDEAEKELAQQQPVQSAPGLADVVQSLGIKPHELTLDQYGQAFGDSATRSVVEQEHRQHIKNALKEGAAVPPEVLADHPKVQIEANKELARDAAQEVLTKNQIDDQAVVHLVDHIVADNEAFKSGYGKDFDPEKHVIRGETKTPLDRLSGDRLQTIINLADGAGARTGRHEAFHAVSNVLLDEGEHNVLLKAFGDHEKAADAFADFQAGKSTPASGLKAIFEKIKKFLERLKNYFAHKKFSTAEDIFEAVDRGEMGGRARQPGAGKSEYSLMSLLKKRPRNVTTPTFRKWFGDSTVVDSEGNPATVYHGTKSDFTEFSPDRRELGFHFAKDPRLANARINEVDPANDENGRGAIYTQGARVLPVYLQLQHPLPAWQDIGDWADVDQLKNLLSPENYGIFTQDEINAMDTVADVRAALQEKGYDGISYHNDFESYKGMNEDEKMSYIVFDPSQIKSAFNAGSFGDGSDIRYSADQLPEFKSTGEAIAFGREHKGDKDIQAALQKSYSNALREFESQFQDPKADLNESSRLATRAQLFREALEELSGKKITPEAQSKYSAENLPATRQPAPMFYSTLEQVVAKKMQNKASVDQVKAMLKNSQEIRKEEIEWSGVDQWLSKQTGSITKEQLQNYLKTNSLKLEEQVRGSKSDSGINTKWGQYTLPGPNGRPAGDDPNSNYREFVVTLPKFGYAEKDRYLQFVEDMAETKSDQKIVPMSDADPFKSFSQLERWIHEKYTSLDKMVEKMTPEEKKKYDKLRAAAEKSEFGSGHWSDKNVLLHVRTTDRIDPEGKKILFIEEVQSDWHEHGRAEGYSTKDSPVQYKYEDGTFGEDEHQWFVTMPDGKKFEVGKGTVGGKIEAEDYIRRLIDTKNSEAIRDDIAKIADAPFKNTWHELGMKMALRRAVEEGYDRVAWTTADMQKKRWANKPIFDYLYGKAIPQFMEKYAKKIGGNFGETEMAGVGPEHRAPVSRGNNEIDLNQQWYVYAPGGDLVGTFDDESDAHDWMVDRAERNWIVSERTEYYITDADGEQVGDYHESQSDAESELEDLAKEGWRIQPVSVEAGDHYAVQKQGKPEFEVRNKDGFALYTTDNEQDAVRMRESLRKEGQLFMDETIAVIPQWKTVETFEDEEQADEFLRDETTNKWNVQENTQWEAYDGDGGDSEFFESEHAAMEYLHDHATEDWSVNENEDFDPDRESQLPEIKPGAKRHDIVKVPAVEITPAMRESLLYTGQPLYKAEDLRRDIDRTLIPSRRNEPKAYTERMALRRSLQRQAAAAAQGAQLQADRVRGVQEVVADAIRKLIPEADRGPYLEEIVNIQTLDDADKLVDKISRDSRRLSAAADKSLKKEEIDRRKGALAADKQERTNLRRLLMREAAVARQAAVATNREITSLKKTIVDSIEAQLPIGERGQFLKMIASSSNWKDVIKAVQRIDTAIEKSARRMVVKSLRREVQRVQASKAIAVDYRWRVNELLQSVLFKKPTAQMKERALQLQKYIDTQRAAGRDVTVPQYVANKLKVLTSASIDDIHVNVLEDILGQVQQLAELGKAKLRTIREIDILNKDRDLKDLAAATVPITSKPIDRAFPGTELTAGGAGMNILKKAYNLGQRVKFSITPIDVLFDVMDGMQNYAGPNYRIFKARTDASFQNYLDEASKIKTEVVEKAKGLDRKSFERIGAYAIGVQDEGLAKLANLGYSPEKIKEIKLTPAEMAFYKWMRKTLDDARPRIAETMRTIYNAELGEVKNYFPFMTDYELADEADVERRMVDQFLGFRKKNPEMGFTKERTGAGDQKVNIDALDVFSKHMDDVAYLNNVGPVTKYLGELANNSAYKAAAGDFGSRMVRDWIDTLARKGGVIGGQQIAVLDKLRANVGAATLAFKLSSTLVQLTPLIEGGALIGDYAFRGGINFSLVPEWRRFVLDNMPEIRERGGDDPAMNEFVKGGKLRAGFEKGKEIGFFALKKLDEWAAAGVAAGAYQKWMADRKLPVDFNKPNKEALAYAQRVVRRTQASPFFKDVPLAITRGAFSGNRSFDRAFFQFQNFVLNQFSLLAYEGARAGALNGQPGVSARVWAWTILAIMATAGIRIGLDELKAEFLGEKHRKKKDFEEELIKQSVQELVSRIPFVSQAMSLVKWGSMPVPAFEAVRRFGEGAKGVYGYYDKENKRLYHQKKPMKKAAVAAATAAGQVAGVPGSVEAGDFVRRNLR